MAMNHYSLEKREKRGKKKDKRGQTDSEKGSKVRDFICQSLFCKVPVCVCEGGATCAKLCLRFVWVWVAACVKGGLFRGED